MSAVPNVIWKHRIPAAALKLPVGASIIHAGLDPDGLPCIWEVHREGAPAAPARSFVVVQTAEPFPGGTHLGSWLAGSRMWHAFEVPPTPVGGRHE